MPPGVPGSVPAMGVKAEGDSPSRLAVGAVSGTPNCTPKPPWAWPQPPLQMPAFLAALQRRDTAGSWQGVPVAVALLRLLMHQCFYSSVLFLDTDDAKDGFPSYFCGVAVEQCFALGCHGSWLIFCLSLVWG